MTVFYVVRLKTQSETVQLGSYTGESLCHQKDLFKPQDPIARQPTGSLPGDASYESCASEITFQRCSVGTSLINHVRPLTHDSLKASTNQISGQNWTSSAVDSTDALLSWFMEAAFSMTGGSPVKERTDEMNSPPLTCSSDVVALSSGVILWN